MSTTPLFHMVNAVTIPVPDLDAGLCFYRDSLGHHDSPCRLRDPVSACTSAARQTRFRRIAGRR